MARALLVEQTPLAHPQERAQVQVPLQPTPEKAQELSITRGARRIRVREAPETSAMADHGCRGFQFPAEKMLCPYPVLAPLLRQLLLAAPISPEKPVTESPSLPVPGPEAL